MVGGALGTPGMTYRREDFEQPDRAGSGYDPATWPLYRKHALTRACRVNGPFTVFTSEGPLKCEDGFLAMDARGYPYPIAADEFEQIYVPAEPADRLNRAATFFELVSLAIEAAERVRLGARSGEEGREYALAITALEDAQMRYTRGRARALGVFRWVDLDSQEAIAERRAFLDDAEAARGA